MHAEPLQKLLTLIMRLLPLFHAQRALATHQAIEHQLVLVRNPLLAFFLRPRVQASYLARSYMFKSFKSLLFMIHLRFEMAVLTADL